METTGNSEIIKKYEFYGEPILLHEGIYLRQIRALRDFSDVKKGDLGGYIQSESNLSHEGDCWIYDNAQVFGNAFVKSNAQVFQYAKICGNAVIGGFAKVHGTAKVSDNAVVENHAHVCEQACIYANSHIGGHALVCGNSYIHGYAFIYENAQISGNARVNGYSSVYGRARVTGKAVLDGRTHVCNNVCVCGRVNVNNAVLRGDVVVASLSDYMVFKNFWSSGRFFTYTKSNGMWSVGCFYGTGEQLIKKAYQDSMESGDYYKKFVEFVKML